MPLSTGARFGPYEVVLDLLHKNWSDRMKGKPGIAFLTIGLAFIAIGASGQRAFLGVGAAFLAIGLAWLVRERRRWPEVNGGATTRSRRVLSA